MRRFSLNTICLFLMALFIGCFSFALSSPAKAQDQLQGKIEEGTQTNLPIPRYVTLRSDKVYARSGPALRYPIQWVYKRDGLPVEIVQEFEHWRQVRGFEGETAWVHKSLLSGKRNALIIGEKLAPLYGGPGYDYQMLARLEPRVIAAIDRCEDDWCRISAGGYRGWLKRNSLWGIYADEDLN